jgi:peptidoglycan/xylan/chitin deacetylase (PgdA/CDA1 family)
VTPVPPPSLAVYVDAPPAFVPRAVWVLETLLAPLGRRVAEIRDPAQAGKAALAYAPAPVAGVPTIPCSAEAMELFAATKPLPAGAFARRAPTGTGRAAEGTDPVAAFPADRDAGFAVPFDLVASSFALLACWDERTSAERDRYGRLPYSASLFAANPELEIGDPAADHYVRLLRAVLTPRLAELGLEPLPPTGWMWGEARFAVALTHDVDNLWRWTRRGFAAAGYRTARAAGRRDAAAVRRELGDAADWLFRHLPRRTDPFWTFPQILGGEDARGVTSTFFVIARHTHRQDGNQPESYRRRIPAALSLLARHDREIGMHGNDADRLGVDQLVHDRELLARDSRADVRGIRYHYLRALYHETLPLLERAGFSYDTTLAFAEREGFRCGCSFPFRPYLLAEERSLDLVELPLAVMDGTLQQPHYRGLADGEAERAAVAVFDRVRQSGGGASLLWHNNRFDPRLSRGYDRVYWRLVDGVREHGGVLTSAGDVVARWRRALGMQP